MVLALGLAAPTPALSQPSGAPNNQAPTSESLIAAGERWRQLYQAGDWDTLRTLYTDDAVLMSQGQPKRDGADTIVTFLQRLSRQGAKVTFQFAPEEAVIEAGLGFVTAKYRMDIAIPGSEPASVAGRSLLIYKWQEGSWKLWRDIDNLAPDAKLEDFE